MNAQSPIHMDGVTPDVALSLLKVSAPDSLIRVRGRVAHLNPYPKDKPTYFYGRLDSISGTGSLSFRCPVDAAPKSVSQCVVIEGAMTIKQSSFEKSGLDVLLIGVCVGEFSLPHAPGVTLLPDARRPKVSLKRFVENGTAQKGILVVGTSTALNDIRTALRGFELPHARWEKISMTDRSAILTMVRAVEPSAVLMSRGGDDASLALWDDPEFVSELLNLEIPFYTALGHAHRLTLADLYADQACSTPTDMGSTLAQLLDEERARTTLEAAYETERVSAASLRAALAKSRSDQEAAVAVVVAEKSRMAKALKISLLVVAVLFLYVVFTAGN